jgi:hypothetical protein
MAKLDEFLKKYPELGRKEREEGAFGGTEAETVLSVIFLGADAQAVSFGHYGARFAVSPNDVLDISETSEAIPNPFGRGQAARLLLRPGAILRRIESIPASSLMSGLPYAIARPSLVEFSDSPMYSPAEETWIQTNMSPRVFRVEAGTGTSTQCRTQSPKWSPTRCDTNSGGFTDDNNQDDGRSDEYYDDDSHQDDLKGDDR